ncbi:MAG TPA: sigma-54 dependent transcriptional regulator [Ferrovibrio sp.]|jgi:two-component system nitrogen regulation response regulator NtrX|uniref:nitrogen assimilation response regulator NtrX n=1 Tax=Ferrovibrio sp. TaxID=1917215 RepID=UPI002B4AC6AF|nr:sigma-54 dependent transcriptional regulator [Ferrovibrio sp.]HLT79277.1 sigma-54 dependent transcriptional regulator [Ferrovibrio sp.]
MARDILIVDDEADIRNLIAGILQDEGYETRMAADSDGALREIGSRRPNAVILDIWLQGSKLDGLEILDRIMRDHANVPVIMISGHGNIETAVAAIKRGAYDYIEKPFKSDRLLLVVERALEQARLRRENEELRQRSGAVVDLIGQSSAIVGLRQAIERVAPTNSRVLISGPAGVGKELVARLLHQRSRRVGGPFISFNVAAMSPERLEQELFGIEEALNGQTHHKIGVLEAAHGGTLFLDEVAEMPPETQAKLLRVLTEQSFERLGGRTRVQVDVRIVSGTVHDLTARVGQGLFRQDLFHRLNVVPLKVPALRDRREDVPLLAKHFVQVEAQRQGVPPRELAEDALLALQSAEWPGNVRELRNAIARLLIMLPADQKGAIHADMLPADLGATPPIALRPETTTEVMALPLRDAREMFEREYLLAQITRFGGNVSRTASFIGMERSALHRKLKALGVLNLDRSA